MPVLFRQKSDKNLTMTGVFKQTSSAHFGPCYNILKKVIKTNFLTKNVSLWEPTQEQIIIHEKQIIPTILDLFLIEQTLCPTIPTCNISFNQRIDWDISRFWMISKWAVDGRFSRVNFPFFSSFFNPDILYRSLTMFSFFRRSLSNKEIIRKNF